ncbi:hypothetical protein [Zoogloea sp.]|uniref:hypothetical protein n=1 Tax=Zoogloea sp. TaxID=49181 RepID=UPI001415A3DD|nr:MAG: hypothetical protein F9K15_12780 [Zoogloea sp.]
MKTFNTTDILLQQLEEQRRANLELASEEEQRRLRAEIDAQMCVILPFTEKERTAAAVKDRLKRSDDDFFYWDKVYFPAEMYDEYFPPGWFHQEIVRLMDLGDKKAHVLHGPRDSAKTGTAKKKFLYNFLHGKRHYQLIGSETLAPAQTAIVDMLYILESNERLKHDYKLQWNEASSENLFARSVTNPAGTYIGALSEDRSSRGKQRAFFLRPDLIYLTDFENNTSSVTKEAVEKRIQRVNEMRTSLAAKGTLLWEGNNFSVDCAMNHLFLEQERGILSEEFILHRFPAWDPSRKGNRRSIWFERFPAKSEADMRSQCKPMDDHDWNGNFQGRPSVKSGDIFPSEHYHEWTELPEDLRGVIFTDPNCSLKEKGDTTAITCLCWSTMMQKYFITSARCKSYSNPNELIRDFLTLRAAEKIREISIISQAFDGNVAQEATWTNSLLNFSRLFNMPLPHIEFKRYRVDDLASVAENEWKAGKFLFPPGFRRTEEGKRYTDQMFKFRLKKAAKKDDAPDSLISALELMQEYHINLIGGTAPAFTSVSKKNIQRAL